MIALDARVADAVDEMHPGIVLLRVPLVDDVIQVGAAEALQTGTIEVAKSLSAMVVRRTDGAALQAEILHRRDGESPLRTQVFSEPVESLRLRCERDSNGCRCWTLHPDAGIRRPADLDQLVKTIAAFGLAKQLRADRPPGIVASA
jgi:hypothetical protein